MRPTADVLATAIKSYGELYPARQAAETYARKDFRAGKSIYDVLWRFRYFVRAGYREFMKGQYEWHELEGTPPKIDDLLLDEICLELAEYCYDEWRIRADIEMDKLAGKINTVTATPAPLVTSESVWEAIHKWKKVDNAHILVDRVRDAPEHFTMAWAAQDEWTKMAFAGKCRVCRIPTELTVDICAKCLAP